MDSDCEEAWKKFRKQRQWTEEAERQADVVLSKIVKALRPSAQEIHARQAVIERVQSVLAGMPDFQPNRYGVRDSDSNECLAKLLVFGSYCSTLYHRASDLDLTITGRWRNRHGQLLEMHQMNPADTADMLHRIKRALIARYVADPDGPNPPMVINARVPLVMFTDAASGVAVDISVCNHAGAFKSRFIRDLAQFDGRFEALFRLVKLWAEVNNLNDPKSGTLNSWSLTQMVIFHLQTSRPAILPPLWLMFHNEPPQGLRPLEQQQQQGQNQGTVSRQQQQQQALAKSGAPYSLLQVCQQQRQRYQPVYHNKNGGRGAGSGVECESGVTELLVGFFVRFNEVLVQWLDYGRHRSVKMCTWLGRWYEGGAFWRQEYLAGFEDPFDTADNTARTLGTVDRNDGGCWRLQEQLGRACSTCTHLSSSADIDSLLLSLFSVSSSEVLRQGFDPISNLLMRQQQPQQQQQQQQRTPNKQLRPRQGQQEVLPQLPSLEELFVDTPVRQQVGQQQQPQQQRWRQPQQQQSPMPNSYSSAPFYAL